MQARLLECHQRAYAIAHEVDPGCMVSSNLACVPAPLHHLTDSWFVDRCRDTLDFVGIDYYYGLSLDNLTVWRDTLGHYRSITPQPESLRYMLRIYAKKFPGLPIWIVEHGMPTDDGRPRAVAGRGPRRRPDPRADRRGRGLPPDHRRARGAP